MGCCKVKLSKGQIVIHRAIDPTEVKEILLVDANLSASLTQGKKMAHPIAMSEGERRFEEKDFSPEGQAALKLLVDEVTAKMLAKAEAKAGEMAKDAGLTLET